MQVDKKEINKAATVSEAISDGSSNATNDVASVAGSEAGPRIHPLSDVQSRQIGPGSQIWQFCVVLAGARIGRDCNLNAQVFVENDVELGDRVTVKCGVQLWDGTTIGDDVFIGPNVSFTNDKYPRSKRYPAEFQRTVIEAGASIGANATILGGVTIGAGALIGAGSVVTRDVPAGELWVGNPARSRGPVR